MKALIAMLAVIVMALPALAAGSTVSSVVTPQATEAVTDAVAKPADTVKRKALEQNQNQAPIVNQKKKSPAEKK